ncbi:hypothetical protein JQC67_15055 [Aurantibacter crassamenti]|uniref:hypothetical protein n=1 Tax=Aurantibacter crassamenti TaxID=1837375 RepID=UPI001939A943|nr:hypothetical protein [Aurantibacter crassamenti]MBM1107471.1 hypothetical protein [Aurantibacter crassamenti]
MALQLKLDNQMLKVLGELTSENTLTLKNHLESFLNDFDNVILNLENVTLLESDSALAIERFYLDFLEKNKGIQIIGRQNQNISGIMKQTKTSYILSNDRV